MNSIKLQLILTILLILAFFLDIVMLAFAFTRNYRKDITYFALLAGSLTFYNFGYVLEILSETIGEVTMALRIENIGIPFVAPFFLLMTIGFFQPRRLRPWMFIASVCHGVLIFLLVFFNDKHWLYYSWIDLAHNGSFYVVQLGKGPFYFLQQAVSLSCMLIAYMTIATRYIGGSHKLHKQMNLFVAGSSFGFIANILNFSTAFPAGIDPTPLALTIGLVFFVVNLYRNKFMDIVPAAFSAAVETMDDAVIVLDNDWGFIYCNKTACNIFPTLSTLTGTEEIMRIKGWPVGVTPKSGPQTIFSLVDDMGQTSIQRVSKHTIHGKGDKSIGISLIIRDITETSNMLKQLEELAITDPLTGVFNRRHFMTLVDRQMNLSMRHNLSMGILLLDIDHFKRVNDDYGHLAGDHTLCKIIQALTAQLRAHDVIARYGGEEFIILSTECDVTGLLNFANRLRRAIENEVIEYEGHTIQVTGSFGVAMLLPGQSYEAVMGAIDRALYTAKNEGRNRVVLGQVDP